MQLTYMQRIFDGGTKFNPIFIPVAIQSTATNPAVAYIRIPVNLKLIGARVRPVGSALTTSAAVTINQGYVSVGDVARMADYLEAMTASEIAAVGVTVVEATNPALLTATPSVIKTLYEALTGANYPASGSAADVLAPGGSSLRAYGALVTDDVLIVSVAAVATNFPIYQIEILAIPN